MPRQEQQLVTGGDVRLAYLMTLSCTKKYACMSVCLLAHPLVWNEGKDLHLVMFVSQFGNVGLLV